MPRGKLIVSTRWPAQIVLVRHGQSVGNLAAAEAGRRGADRLDLDFRDADTPLSETGHQQAGAVGAFLKAGLESDCPELVVSSPYARAAQTAASAVKAWGCEHELVLDERLRERDLGVFDGLTSAGIRSEYATEADRRVWLFTHQAVIMSFRYVLEDLTEQELLEIDATTDLPNCSMTSYRAGEGGVDLVRFADTTAVDEAQTPRTAEPSRAREANHGG